ncbi:hypothetical protein BDC45DRAFT_531036 [Circinella umbellata]|nr:hypothetical protein BDC45DRAFT_531036 [Circinella umbellata]
MAEKKGDYVAVPTTETAFHPLPQPHPIATQVIVQPCPKCVHKQCRLKKGRRAFKIIAATTLLAFATFKVILPALFSVFAPGPEPPLEIFDTPFNIPHGKGHLSVPKEDLVGFEYAFDAAEFMGGLNAAFGERPNRNRKSDPLPKFAPECCANNAVQTLEARDEVSEELYNKHHREHGKHHKHHNKHHRHKHGDKKQRMPPPQQKGCPCGPMPKHDRHPQALSPLPPPPAHGGLMDRHPPPPHFCSAEDALESTSKIFTFSQEQFQRAALYVGSGFPDSGKVFFSKSGEAGSDIKVNVTLLHGSEDAVKATTISAFDHEGEYVVEMKRRLPPPGKGPQPPTQGPPPHQNTTALCAKYEVHIIFPADLNEFESFDLRLRDGQVESCPSLKDINFAKFHAGIGRGYINFASLDVQRAKLGVLSGHVRGHYGVSEKLSASVLRGSSDLSAIPTGESAKIAVTALHGHAQVQLPADRFEGDFLVHTTFHGEPLVEAPNPTDIHIVKYRHNLKSGYYKNKDTGYKVFVHVKKGDSKLIFN